MPDRMRRWAAGAAIALVAQACGREQEKAGSLGPATSSSAAAADISSSASTRADAGATVPRESNIVTRFAAAILGEEFVADDPRTHVFVMGPGLWELLKNTDPTLSDLGAQMDINAPEGVMVDGEYQLSLPGRIFTSKDDIGKMWRSRGVRAWAAQISNVPARPLWPDERDLLVRILPKSIPRNADAVRALVDRHHYVFVLDKGTISYADDLAHFAKMGRSTVAFPSPDGKVDTYEAISVLEIHMVNLSDEFDRNYNNKQLAIYTRDCFRAIDRVLRKERRPKVARLRVKLVLPRDGRIIPVVDPTPTLPVEVRARVVSALRAIRLPHPPDTMLKLELTVKVLKEPSSRDDGAGLER